MEIGATYLCPVRGLTGLEPPESERLGKAAKAAGDLGLGSLTLPVLEEALLSPGRRKVQYLDGLIAALDRMAEAKLSAEILAPAQRLLGLDWIPPYLAAARPDPRGRIVFLQGQVRRLNPFAWWEDTRMIQRRIALFRELVGVLSGHPALGAWVLVDGLLDWAPPDPQPAEFFLRSIETEIRERGMGERIAIRFDPGLLLLPETPRALARRVDLVEMRYPETDLGGAQGPQSAASELTLAAFIGTVAQWLFERPAAVQIGQHPPGQDRDSRGFLSAALRLALQGISAIRWIHLVDPEPPLLTRPPWSLQPRLAEAGLLDQGLDPKKGVEESIEILRTTEPGREPQGFIDIDIQEYLEDPGRHFPRLLDHFREWSR